LVGEIGPGQRQALQPEVGTAGIRFGNGGQAIDQQDVAHGDLGGRIRAGETGTKGSSALHGKDRQLGMARQRESTERLAHERRGVAHAYSNACSAGR
jgi:hypothetical protein